VAVNDNVDRIEPLAAAQGARDLFRSWRYPAQYHWDQPGPQSRDERGNVCDCRVDEDDFPSDRHVIGSQ
jgi:hypothetical protein